MSIMSAKKILGAKILLVEDDLSLGATLNERLKKEGFDIFWARSQNEAIQHHQTTAPDLAIIDVGLPDGNGFDLAKKFKEQRGTSFIFVTAMNSAEHRLTGYEIGADEYIPKPFLLKELLLRIQKVLSAARTNDTLKVHDLFVDLKAMTITFPDRRIEYLTARDSQILRYLVASAPRVIARDELVKEICRDNDQGVMPTQRTIDNSIVRLRQLLGGDSRQIIRSVRGIGYQWIGEAQ